MMDEIITSLAHEFNFAARDAEGILDGIAALGQRYGALVAGDVEEVVQAIEASTPMRAWNKVRRSECRILLRRYWEIEPARQELAGAGLPAGYHSIIAVLRHTSATTSVATMVGQLKAKSAAAVPTSKLLARLTKTAGSMGYAVRKHSLQGNRITMVLEPNE